MYSYPLSSAAKENPRKIYNPRDLDDPWIFRVHLKFWN
jgi:hypothetical protein